MEEQSILQQGPSMTFVRDDTETSPTGSVILHRFYNGAISGFICGAALQPLQVIKTSMQVKPVKLSSVKQMDVQLSKPY